MRDVDPTPGLDLVALSAYLHDELPEISGTLSAELLAGGRSNLTYLVGDGERQWVLRRPPLGHVLESAHDMGREYRVQTALAATPVPVPRTYLLCTDTAVIGAPFYLMEYATGTVFRTRDQLRRLPAPTAEALADVLVGTLADLHAVDPAAAGLADLGRPDGYLERQVRRWQTQLAASRSRVVPGLAELGTELARDVPVSPPPALVHGDYRLDNVVVDESSGTPRVRAVLDWEMATLGDPLTDLASMLVWWDGIAGLDSPVAAVPGEVPGYPPGRRLLDRYTTVANVALGNLSWYYGFAYYKVAAIFESIHYRSVQGLTVGTGFDRIGALVAPLADRGRAALAGTVKEPR